MTSRMVASLLALTLAFAARGYAQESDEGEPYVIAQRYMVPSAVLEEDRPIAVSLPPGYDTTAAYPVVYVMDGFGHLTHTVGAVRFLASNDRMPDAIVVTIGNTSGNRTRDMTPPSSDREAPATAGGAARFQAFLRDELKPWVEARYRTRPYDVLIGHSFGGLFISHVLNTQPDLFDAYVSISPSLWWDEERFVASLDDVFDRFPDAKGALYMTMGNEGGEMLASAWHLASTLERHAPATFRWKWLHMPTETHGSVPARSTYDGLEWIFSGWYPVPLMAELAERGAEVIGRIDAHYVELSSEMGWEVKPPLAAIVATSVRLGEAGRSADALAVAEAAASWYPESAYARMGVGEAHESACRLEEAERHQSRALRMAEEADESDGLVDFIRSELEALRTKLRDGEC